MENKLGNYLKELRGSRSLREISEATGGKVSHSYIGELEKGISHRGNAISPSPDKLKALASVYSVSYSKLMQLAGYETVPDNIIPTSSADFTEVPVVGTIKAGPNGLALENYLGVESVLRKDLGGGHDYFWLVVSGDSMIGDGIHDGDFALIKRTPDFNNGDICAIIVDGEEGTLKHVTQSKDSIVLTASNPAYQPRIFVGDDMNEILVAGRLVETKRKY